MKTNLKSNSAYKTIGEVAKELGLINYKNGSLQTHTLRFWEKEFKQLRPSIRAGNRRYYSKKNLESIKLVKYLLKDLFLSFSYIVSIFSCYTAKKHKLNGKK